MEHVARIFVGVFVFALLMTLAVVPFTLMVLSGYEAPTLRPFVDASEYGAGHKFMLALASLFSLAFVVVAWRALLQGARRQAQVVREKRQAQEAVEVGGTSHGPAADKSDPDLEGYG